MVHQGRTSFHSKQDSSVKEGLKAKVESDGCVFFQFRHGLCQMLLLVLAVIRFGILLFICFLSTKKTKQKTTNKKQENDIKPHFLAFSGEFSSVTGHFFSYNTERILLELDTQLGGS